MDPVDDMDLLLNIIGSENPTEASINFNPLNITPIKSSPRIMEPSVKPQTMKEPCIKVIEQPSSQRFRYKCESRSAGSIPGVNSTPDHKTYPTIEIENYSGEVVILVSCVTKDEPYRPHPHRLVGKDCNNGICCVTISGPPPLRAVFSNIGIQCVKKKDMKNELAERMERNINPFGVKLDDMKYLTNIDLNMLRLCFEAYVKLPDRPKRICKPVVSQPICQKNLAINTLCSCAAKVTGGDDIILLCNEVSKDDIKIRFFEQASTGQVIWEDYAKFSAADVHKQTAIKFRTPRYARQDIERPVKVFIQLVRPSDDATSEPLPFEYFPNPDEKKRKRPDFNLLRQKLKQREVEEISRDLQQATTPFLDVLKVEPNVSPQYLGMSNASSTTTSPSPFAMHAGYQLNDIKPLSPCSDTQMSHGYNLQAQLPQNQIFINNIKSSNDVEDQCNAFKYKQLQGYNYDNNIQMDINYQSPLNQFDNSNGSSNYDFNQQHFNNITPLENDIQQQQIPNDSLQTFSGLSDLVMELFTDNEMGNLTISN